MNHKHIAMTDEQKEELHLAIELLDIAKRHRMQTVQRLYDLGISTTEIGKEFRLGRAAIGQVRTQRKPV